MNPESSNLNQAEHNQQKSQVKKDRKHKLNVRPNLKINKEILELADCLSPSSQIMKNFGVSLEDRSYPRKPNPDGLVYEYW